MRLGRSIAALGGAFALVAAGAALASPVAADESGLHLDNDIIRTSPDKPVTATGTGCAPVNNKPSTVTWAIFTPKETAVNPTAEGAVTANEDGTWSVTLDIPSIVKDAGLGDPTAGVVNFGCVSYDGETTSGEQADLEIDSTDVDGKAEIVSSDTDGDGEYDHQHFDIDLTGFTPGETVTGYLVNAETYDHVRDIFTATADGTGRVAYTGDVPTDLPNGKYLIMIRGSQYGEGLVSKPIEVIDGWWNIQDEDIPIDPSPAPTADPTTDPTTAPAPVVADPTTAAAKPANGRSGLASTGAGLGIAVVAGGLLASGGILAARRRRAA